MTQQSDQLFSWPNILTFARISAVPLMVLFYYLPVSWSHAAAALIFAFAGFTDWLDGYLARYLKQSTKLGAFLDPVADKLMVSTALIILVAQPTFQFVSTRAALVVIPTAVITVPAAIIVGREIIVSALREWMAEVGKRQRVAVSSMGKVKTALQMGALVILLYCDNASPAPWVFLGLVLLYVAVVLTIWSMCIYLKAAWQQLISED